MAIKINEAVTGVISAHSVNGDLLDDFFQKGIDLGYEAYIEENGEEASDEYENDDTTILVGFIKDENGKYIEDEKADYSLLYRTGSVVLQITRSTHVKLNCAICSPCYPGQADLDSDHGNTIAYCLPVEEISDYAEKETKNGIFAVAQNIEFIVE